MKPLQSELESIQREYKPRPSLNVIGTSCSGVPMIKHAS